MSEEEKKAIERIEDIIYKRDETNYGDDREITLYEDDIQKISKLLNLIEKQQKEIEELKKPKFIMNAETGEVTKIDNDFISKDKIRDKIKEIEEHLNFENTELEDYTINVLKELLEEE